MRKSMVCCKLFSKCPWLSNNDSSLQRLVVCPVDWMRHCTTPGGLQSAPLPQLWLKRKRETSTFRAVSGCAEPVPVSLDGVFSFRTAACLPVPSWTEFHFLINKAWWAASVSDLCSASHFFRKKSPARRGVCVEHLNRCKTSIYHQTSRGTRHPWPTVCNEAMVLDGISGLITLTYLQNCDYLLFRVCFFCNPTLLQSWRVNGTRLSLQPDTRFFCTAFAIWCLFLHWLFGWLSTHFSPFQNAELRMNNFGLGLILPFTLTSWVFRWLLRRGLLGI